MEKADKIIDYADYIGTFVAEAVLSEDKRAKVLLFKTAKILIDAMKAEVKARGKIKEA